MTEEGGDVCIFTLVNWSSVAIEKKIVSYKKIISMFKMILPLIKENFQN